MIGSKGLAPLLASLAALASAGNAQADPAEDAAIAWLEATAAPFASSQPAPSDLRPLVSRLAGGRVIGIGEVTHGTHEDQAFKAELIKALVTAGAIDALALEANRDAGRGFDRYVRYGEGDPAALVRSRSFFRIWKGDEFAGLLLWLRAWNLAHPERTVRIFGIDNQDAGVDLDLALTFLAARDPTAEARLRPIFGTLIPAGPATRINPSAWIQASEPGQLPAALAAAAELRDLFASNAAAWSTDPGFAEAAYAARIAWQNLHQYELEVGVVDLESLPPDYLARRDRYMAENLSSLLAAGERAAFWAHDGHVQETLPQSYVAQGFTSVGAELRETLGEAYRTVGFTYSRATVLTRRVNTLALDLSRVAEDEPIEAINDRPQDLGSALNRLSGNGYVFDLATPAPSPLVAEWMARPLWRGWIGAVFNPDSFQPGFDGDVGQPFNEGFDNLVWFRRMTPQRRWPTQPAPTP